MPRQSDGAMSEQQAKGSQSTPLLFGLKHQQHTRAQSNKRGGEADRRDVAGRERRRPDGALEMRRLDTDSDSVELGETKRQLERCRSSLPDRDRRRGWGKNSAAYVGSAPPARSTQTEAQPRRTPSKGRRGGPPRGDSWLFLALPRWDFPSPRRHLTGVAPALLDPRTVSREQRRV